MSTNPNEVTPTTEVTKRTTDAIAAAETTINSPVPLSVNKLAANRRNAAKSTGPRTATGKLASRMNAVRHGILSSAVVVRGLRIQEQEDEFRAVREQCWECLVPVGRIEEMLADKIVTAWWRSRRALIAETGEIVKSVDGGLQHRANREPLGPWIFMDPTHDASVEMMKSSAGLEYRRRILETVREAVKRDGELTEKTIEWVRVRFTNTPNAMTRALEEYRATYLANASAAAKAMADTSAVTIQASSFATASAAAQCAMADESADGMADTEVLSMEEVKLRHQTAVDRYVEGTLGWQAELNAEHRERDDKQETAGQAADVLPSAEVLEKIMRYEGSLDRQLYRAMNQLERLQRRRSGENVSAPLMMDVMR